MPQFLVLSDDKEKDPMRAYSIHYGHPRPEKIKDAEEAKKRGYTERWPKEGLRLIGAFNLETEAKEQKAKLVEELKAKLEEEQKAKLEKEKAKLEEEKAKLEKEQMAKLVEALKEARGGEEGEARGG
jgi:hypothetical protein